MKSYEYIFIGIIVSLIIVGALAGYFKINFIYIIIFGIIPAILFVVYVVNEHEKQNIQEVQHK